MASSRRRAASFVVALAGALTLALDARAAGTCDPTQLPLPPAVEHPYAPRPLRVEHAPSVALASGAVDLYCGAGADEGYPAVVLVPPLGAPAERVAPLARSLASQGAFVVVAALPADAGAAAALAAIVRDLGTMATRRGFGGTCGYSPSRPPRCCDADGARTCEDPRTYTTPPSYTPRAFVAVGTGARALLREGAWDCAHTSVFLVDPEVGDEERARLSACASGQDSVPLDMELSDCGATRREAYRIPDDAVPDTTAMGTTTLIPGTNHCDAVFGDGACASSCGPATAAGTARMVHDVTVAVGRGVNLSSVEAFPEDTVGRPRALLAREAHTTFSVGLTFGYGTATSATEDAHGALALSVRPEVIFLRRGSGTLGLGLYGEAGSFPERTVFAGAGVSAVVPLVKGYGYAHPDFCLTPSLGLDVGDGARGADGAATAGLMFGWRMFDEQRFFDAPVGIRVDGRLGLGDGRERAIGVAVHADVFGAAALGYLF